MSKAAMTTVITSTLAVSASTSKSGRTYSVTASAFGGVARIQESGRIVERAKLGPTVQIAISSDRKVLKAWVEKCQAAGDFVEVQATPLI
jgi:hypothetical protein